MPGHYPNLSIDNEAQLWRIVANLFREEGWKVVEEPRSANNDNNNVAPDFLVSGHGKKFVVELKRASEGRRDRVIPLLSQAALEAVHYARVLPGHTVPLAIVGANRIRMPSPRTQRNLCGNGRPRLPWEWWTSKVFGSSQAMGWSR
jgi:Holliday junction resolvase